MSRYDIAPAAGGWEPLSSGQLAQVFAAQLENVESENHTGFTYRALLF